ncbi:MAG: small multi-drug export protein [Kiritimatiellae bacterium]|nr:small multi-drug export protein [Kiritimatiellia bacterium]
MRNSGLPDAAVVLAISTLPIVELRGAIPAGHIMGMNPWLVYVLAVIGNMLPIPFILLLLGPVSKWCMRFRIGKVFFDWLFARTRRKAAGIEKYETLGLTIFVAIPLPVTGGWTGAAAAFLMGMKFQHAMLSILFGVMIAGVIMTVLALMGWLGALVAGVVLIGLAVSALLGMFKREEKKEEPRIDAN